MKKRIIYSFLSLQILNYELKTMFKNYFKIAWRNLMKGKSFSFLNVTGLAIGMAGAILILLWLQNEISFDKFHANKNNLYEVYALARDTGGRVAEVG
jgi:putative ABC transport system permease protein